MPSDNQFKDVFLEAAIAQAKKDAPAQVETAKREATVTAATALAPKIAEAVNAQKCPSPVAAVRLTSDVAVQRSHLARILSGR